MPREDRFSGATATRNYYQVMAFTQEIVDFTGLTESKIRTKLKKLNIPLTAEETLKIQNDMLGRAPSLAELILFSIQGSEHCSY